MGALTHSANSVRSEYVVGAQKGVRLLQLLGHHPSHEELNRIKCLTDSIEWVDRLYDSIPEEEPRSALRKALLYTLEGQEPLVPLPLELGFLITELRTQLLEVGRVDLFTNHLRDLFKHTEALRAIKEIREAIELTLKEGEETARLVVLMLERPSDETVEVLQKLIRVYNLADDIIDLPEDLNSGERAIENTAEYYQVAVPRLLKETFGLLRLLPWSLIKKLSLRFPHYLRELFKARRSRVEGNCS